MGENELLADIDDYLESIHHGRPVTTEGLEDIIEEVTSRTNLSKDAVEFIIINFFEEIRNAMLRGDIVKLKYFGKFRIVSPKITGSKRKIAPRFKPGLWLIKKIKKTH